MKVLFKKHVINVAKAGEIKDVKSGYAQNMLFPKGLAVLLTPTEEKKYKDELKKDNMHRMHLIENRHNIVEKINAKTIKFKLKASKTGKVYGGIGEKDVISEIKRLFKIELTKKHIDLPGGHIKKIGEQFIFIKLGKDASAKINVIVESE